MMAGKSPNIHISDDWISIKLPDWKAILAAQNILSRDDHWTEIVPGIDSIAVQFDPALVSPGDAARNISDQISSLTHTASNIGSELVVPVCYAAAFAPDREFVARQLGIANESFPSWHASRMQRVAMLGFMPGFAYLESAEQCPDIGRLASPRQLVSAGSVGFIGRQNCIYSFDSPGGWPIIGRTPLRLFDPEKSHPALLSTGQPIRFEPISEDAFHRWQAEDER
jgi:KipI family sensor histidine kinase inhibitor